jgi:translation elongation factor EF-G
MQVSRELEKTVITINKMDKRHNDFYLGLANAYSTLC